VRALVDAAVAQYGVDRVARYLRVDVGDGGAGPDVLAALHGERARLPAGPIFANGPSRPCWPRIPRRPRR